MEDLIPPGLSLQSNVFNSEEIQRIISWLDQHPWEHVNPHNPNSRRVQQYGYGYGYRSRNVSPTSPMEGPILEIAQKLEIAGLLKPAQCIVNEYYRNQGISAHIDNKNFGDTIVGVSIGTDTVMTFRKGDQKFDCFLPNGSVMMMTGEARYSWTHEISSNVSYYVGDTKIIKPADYRRISLTYRELA